MKFTRRQIITKATLIFRIIIKLNVVDHQSMYRAVTHHFILLSIRFDLLSILLPRQLDVIFGHGTRQRDVLSGQGAGVLQAFDELERQSWSTANTIGA